MLGQTNYSNTFALQARSTVRITSLGHFFTVDLIHIIFGSVEENGKSKLKR